MGATVKICRVVVENSRRVPDLDVEVRRHLVVVGPNDVGKSSLLRSLDILFRAPLAEVYRWGRDIVRDSASPMVVRVTFEDLNEGDRSAFADEIELLPDAESSQLVGRLTLQLAVHVNPEDPDDLVAERRAVKEGAGYPVSTTQLRALGWSYMRATRTADVELEGRAGAARRILRDAELGTDAELMREAAAEFDRTLNSAKSVQQLRELIESSLGDLLPNDSTRGVALGLANLDEDEVLRAVELQLRQDGATRSIGDQSDGLRALTTIALHRLSRSSTQLFGIDEPESHLHPASQASIGRALSEGTAQSLLATHSPEILAAFQPSDVLVLTRSVARQCRDLSLDADWRTLIKHWMGPTLVPLTAEEVLLVEGVSDRIILESAARALGAPLEKDSRSVVVVFGAPGFKPALRLFGNRGFGLAVRVLVDELELPIAREAMGIDESGEVPDTVSVCAPDLEAECVSGLGVERHAQLLVESGHYTEEYLLGRLGVDDLVDVAESTYLSICTDKVRIAAALSACMTEADALKLGTITTFLRT